MLGKGFNVRNFGVSGLAVQQTAGRPYRNSRTFRLSCAFKPDIVLIMLGTNDSTARNWRGVRAFTDEYRDLATHYLSLESRPRVWLLTPPALFQHGRRAKVSYGMEASAIQEMCAAIKSLARELGCGGIDINEATAGHPEAFKFDGVHPGGAGAALIAQAVRKALG
jgi:lysophospholipase L1-like esterase